MAGDPGKSPFAGMKPPTVLQVIPTLDTGGAERTTIDMAAAIIKAGGRAIVASQGGRLVNDLLAMGGTHVRLPVHSKNPLDMMMNIGREHQPRPCPQPRTGLERACSGKTQRCAVCDDLSQQGA